MKMEKPPVAAHAQSDQVQNPELMAPVVIRPFEPAFFADTTTGGLVPFNAGSAQQISKHIRATLLIAGGMVGAFMIAGALIPIEGAVIAQGAVQLEQRTKILTHPTGGVLASMMVREGDQVQAGQTMLRFEDAVPEANAAFASDNQLSLMASIARLTAERDGRGAISFPAQLVAAGGAGQTAMEHERKLFQARQADLAGQASVIRERGRQAVAQISGLRSQIAGLNAQLRLIQPELSGVRQLYAERLVTQSRLSQLERTAASLRTEIANASAEISRLQSQSSETQRQISATVQSFRASAAAELVQALTALSQANVRRTAAQDNVAKTRLAAPQSGTVSNIAYTTPGSFIPAGQPILEIVPNQGNLVVEAQIRPFDIDEIYIGQAVRANISSTLASTAPEMRGRVSFISPDRVIDPKSGQPYYRVQVSFRSAENEPPAMSLLAPGRAVDVYFTTESRSILSYLIQPLSDQFSRSFRN